MRLRRHELTNPMREERSPFVEASSLALHVGSSLGMAPRFATAHLATHNKAEAGLRKSFTSLPDEFLFIDENTRGILSLQRVAEALTKIVHLGVSSPVADVLFVTAKDALRDVIRFNTRLFEQLDVQRFFYSGAALLQALQGSGGRSTAAPTPATSRASMRSTCCWACAGPTIRTTRSCWSTRCCSCCRPTRPGWRDCMMRTSLLDELLALAPGHSTADWFQQNARAYLEVCDLFGQTAAQHHDTLVKRFIEEPARDLETSHLAGITASGPPLSVLLRALEMLRDLRTAADRHDIPTRYQDLTRLRGLVVSGPRQVGSPDLPSATA